MENVKLNIINVSKSFIDDKGRNVDVLEDISINIPNNQFISILGPSGCGKTTLLKIVAGLIESTKGEIFLDGVKITKPTNKCGYVPQSFTLFPWLTVWKNIEFGLKISNVEVEKRTTIIENLLKIIGLEKYKHYYPKSLSGGMQQRVAIARTLAVEPEILLMDEPFGSLDTQTRSLMQENILEIWEKKKKTVLFVTHDIDEAIFLSDCIYISSSNPGKIIKSIKIDLKRPRNYNIKMHTSFIKYKKIIDNIMRVKALKND